MRLDSEVVITFWPYLMVIFRRAGVREHDAEDLAQQTLIRVGKYVERKKLDGIEKDSWRRLLFGGARFELLSYRRKHSGRTTTKHLRRFVIVDSDLLDKVVRPFDHVELNELIDRITDRMDVKLAAAIRLWLRNEYSIAELAERLEVGSDSVQQWIASFRRQLRKQMAELEID